MKLFRLLLVAACLMTLVGLVAQTTTLSVGTQIAAGNVTQGTIKHPIFHFQLARNATGTVTLTGVSFTTAGTYTTADVSKFQLWSNTTNTFSTATQISSDLTTGLGTGSHDFAAFTQPLAASATRYFWITTDFTIDATTTRTLNVSAWTTTNFTVSSGTKSGSATASGNQTITAFASLAADYFRSRQTGNWGTAGTWESSHDGSNWATATLAPSSTANTITVRNTHTVTVATGVSVDQVTVDAGGKVNVSSGVTLTIADGPDATDMTVNGTLRNNAGTITTTGVLAFGSGAVYQHNHTTSLGTVPTATWNANSTCEIIGYTSATGNMTLGQTFGNFTWNCPNQTAASVPSANETLDNIAGNLSIISTGSGKFVLGKRANTTTVSGSLLISGGTFDMSAKKALVINLSGNLTISGGTLTESGGGSGQINFAKAGTQVLSITGTPTISQNIIFNVNSGATLEFETADTVLSGSVGTFTAASGSTLIIKHAGGIASTGATGCVRTTGIRTFSTGANYTYSGSTAQDTGTGLTGANILIFSNTAGTTLSAAVNTITTSCTIQSGATLATNNLAMAFQGNFVNSGTFTAGSSNITIGAGTATQSIAGFTTTGNVSMTKTGGTATLTGNVSGGALTINGSGGTLNLGAGLTHTFSGTWTRTKGTLNGSSSTLRLGGSVSGTGGTFTPSTGTVDYYASGPQTVAALTYNNLTLSGSGAKTTSNTRTVNGILSMEGTATMGGTVVTYGASSSLRYNGSSTQTVGVEWPSTFARPITISNLNGVTLNASKTAYTGTLTNNGLLTTGTYQLTGTVSNNGTIKAARTDIMSSGTLTNNTGSTIDYTIPLNIPASTGYYNLTLSASGLYVLTGSVTGINTLTLTTATTYLHPNGYTLGYTTLAGLGSILTTPMVTLASASPAVAAATIAVGTTKNPVYRFTLSRESSTGTVNLTGLSFTTTGTATASDITNFQLWTSATDALSGATKIGTDVTSGQGAGSHNFGSFSQALSVSSTRYFWITADIASGATTTRTVTVSALTTSDVTIDSGDKTGSSSAGGQQTIGAVTTTLASANPAVPAASLGRGTVKNPIYRFTLTANSALNLTGLTFTVTGTYQAADIDNFKLWSSTTDDLNAASQVGNTDTSIAASGSSQTIDSVSQALAQSVTRYFWITTDLDANATATRTLIVSALTTSNFTVSTGNKAGSSSAGGTQTIANPIITLSSTNPAVSAGTVAVSSLKNPIYKFSLTRDAAAGTVNLTGLSFTTTGTHTSSDITKFQLWGSASDNLGSATQIGVDLTTSLGTGAHSFASFTQAITVSSTLYLWITTDISSGATAGRTITVSALTTASYTLSFGDKAGTAYAGGTQTVGSVTTTLASSNPAVTTSDLARSQQKRALHRFTLSSNGNVSLSAVSFTSAGDYDAADIVKFQLWTGILDDLNAAGQIGSDISSSLGSGSHSFSSLALDLTPSLTQYFWITVDAAAAATVDNYIYLSAISTSDITVSSGTKSGSTSAGGDQTFCLAREWTYAKGQTIGQLSNAGTGYQVRVKVFRSTGSDSGESVYVGTSCREDFGDIRFFEDYTPLDYWMESATYGSSAVFWVEMNGNLSDSDLFLVMRYGNNSVTTTSNGTNTFLFFDDFNRSDDSFSKWTKHKTLNGSTISIPKGTNYVRNGGGVTTDPYGHSVLGSSATYNSFTNGVVEYKFRVSIVGISEVGIRGTFGNPGSGYKGRSDARTDSQGGQSILSPPYYTWSFLADAGEDLDSPTPDTWYRGSFLAYGTTLRLYRDEVLKRSSSSGSVSGPGEISLQNHYGVYTDYDWAAVRKYANADPSRGTWYPAPVAIAATATCHNGFTARWQTVSGVTGYELDVLEENGVTFVSGWEAVSVSLNVKRVEIVDIDTAYKYRVRAVFSGGTSPSSNVIDVSTTDEVEGISATTSVEGASILTYVPPVTGGPAITDNDVRIDPDGTSTDDFSIEVTYHPTGYDIYPDARLLAKITCSNNSALNGVFTLRHVGLGFTPASAVQKFGGGWQLINPSFYPDSTVVTVSGISKDAKGTLEILIDDGSGTLPVELSSFTATFSAQGFVMLQWVTQSETNVLGYRIYRNHTLDLETAQMLNAFIEATNTSQMQTYVFWDQEIYEDGTYYYWLQNLDFDGSAEYHGPTMITVTANQGSTPPIPVVPGLNSAYPNPFNPSLTIVYGVPVRGEVDLSVYNIKGQLVTQLLRESKETGTYRYVWNGQDDHGRQVSSGLYLLRMTTGNKHWSKKITFSK